MNKEDMIDLIKAFESFEKINSCINRLTNGHYISNPDFDGLYNIYEVIKRHSMFPGEDDYDIDTFRAIMFAVTKTPEEKYELLKRDDDYNI